jgi:hypothetical protein
MPVRSSAVAVVGLLVLLSGCRGAGQQAKAPEADPWADYKGTYASGDPAVPAQAAPSSESAKSKAGKGSKTAKVGKAAKAPPAAPGEPAAEPVAAAPSADAPPAPPPPKRSASGTKKKAPKR